MEDFRSELLGLTEHCVRAGVAGLTPSDVVGVKPEQADLDAVLRDLELV
jgi:hypothetical protein